VPRTRADALVDLRGTTSFVTGERRPLVDGCDGPARPVLLGRAIRWIVRPFFRWLPGDGRINAAGGRE
ncbi:MAG: hypothetical protein ABGZ36_02840, partial [Actinomycetota bacterium]